MTTLLMACTHQSKVLLTASNYPPQVEAIIVNKCAVSGCHNDLSYENADELQLTTWDNLFKGSSTGSTVIPYRPEFSSFCYFTNTDTTLGITLQPTMPYNSTPLSKAEYQTLRNWISAGAPSADGRVKFADDALRKKIYITNRMCNVVTVVDAASMLQARYIDVGGNDGAQFPYYIKASPDRQSWYVSFFTPSSYVQKFNAVNDSLAGQIELGTGVWTSFGISGDSNYGWFVDNSSPGKIAYVNLASNSLVTTYRIPDGFKYPMGIAVNDQLHKVYVGTSSGNFVYGIDVTSPLMPEIHEVPIDGSGTVQFNHSLDPTELVADEQSGTCYMACVASGEVRVVDMAHDSLVAVISLGSGPAYMGISHAAQKLFVSCPDDMTTFPGNRGSVAVIDLQTNKLVKRINTGYQPYGIAVDDDHKIVAVVNANISSGGPASHHVSGCGKKNGNVTFISENTLNMVPDKLLELAVFPFTAAYR